MSVKNKTNKNDKRSQKGRSMVEMLGVLAIVGVLSVGGVYGYGVAMKKHKANELLHQASMLATTISAQIQSKGQLPQNIENFGDSKYGTFGTLEKVNDEQFKMQITGMDEAVCEQMEKMAGGMVRKAECSETTLTLTYNNNLSSDKVAADYNDDTTGGKCEGAGYKWCGGECKKDCTCDVSDIVKLYNCETQETTDCCPYTESCEQPTDCGCSADSDCPGDQKCYETICACPKGGRLGKDGTTCCSGDHAWLENETDQDYMDASPACGCPENGFAGKDGLTCCSPNKIAWSTYLYSDVDVENCGGCPLDGEYVDGVCCQLGWAFTGGTYSDVNIGKCGCPLKNMYGGMYEGVFLGKNGVCCLEEAPRVWDGSGYENSGEAYYNANCVL